MPFDSAYCPVAGRVDVLAEDVGARAVEALGRRFSFETSSHAFVQISFTVAPGCIACAPSANAFACRITSGIGNGTT